VSDRVPFDGVGYKYRKVDLLGERLLAHREIYFARPDQLNDPFDCRPAAVLPPDHDVEELAKQIFDQDSRDYIKYNDSDPKFEKTMFDVARHSLLDTKTRTEMLYKSIADRTGVFSLSKSRNVASLWAYYSDQHAGFCVGIRCGGFPVKYRSARPQIDIVRIRDRDAYADRVFANAALTKSSGWKHEEEVRALSDWPMTMRLAPDDFSGVFVGPAMPSKDLDFVRGWMNDGEISHVPLYRLQMHDDNFKLVPTPIPL
jgi:hypothetical protein